MSKLRIGVLRGGPSSEYEVSLKTGENVLKFLPEKYEKYDVLITKEGDWIFNGVIKSVPKIIRGLDAVFIALHGEYGEDGKVQNILEHFQIPFTGSKSLASAFAMNKFLARHVFEKAGILMPKSILIRAGENISEISKKIFSQFSPPWILKPLSKGSSVGVKIISKFEDLENTIFHELFYNDKILFEEYIKGREATCGVLENFRGEKHYALPPVEIIPPEENNFFDYEAKYGGNSREICPANFDLKTKKEIEFLARKAHQVLGCKGYSRSDFIVSPRGIFLLELNNLPGLTSESLFPKSAATVGISFSDMLDHLIQISLVY